MLGVGVVERIGQEMSNIEHKTGEQTLKLQKPCSDHKSAVEWILETMLHKTHGCISHIDSVKAVGHRVLHGGEVFTKSVIIDDNVIEFLESIKHLGPLHMPANITGVRALKDVLPDVPHCAVMDTAWH